MSLFIGRYVSCMVMFVLGLKAPGIMHQFEYLEHDDSDINIHPRVSTYKNIQSSKENWASFHSFFFASKFFWWCKIANLFESNFILFYSWFYGSTNTWLTPNQSKGNYYRAIPHFIPTKSWFLKYSGLDEAILHLHWSVCELVIHALLYSWLKLGSPALSI